jgi:hypothetical protein
MPSATLSAVSQTVTQTGAPIRFPVSGELAISPLKAFLTANPKYPVVGQKVTIALTVSNYGTASVNNLKAGLEAATGTEFVSSIAGPAPPGLAALAPGTAAIFTWTLSVSGNVTIRLSASATGTVAPMTAPLAVAASFSLTVPPVARLETSLSPNPMHVSAGQWVGLVLTVSNTGDVTADAVVPVLRIASGAPLLSFQKGPVPPGPVAIKPGSSVKFTFTYSASGSGLVTFTGTVTGRADLSGPGIISRSATSLAATTKALSEKTAKTSTALKFKVKRILFPPRPPAPKEKPFTSFEKPEDIGWADEGFVMLSRSEEHATDGKYSMRAEFILPTDLTLTVTGEWKPSISLKTPARGTRIPLEPRDWSSFVSFRADIHNDSAQPAGLAVIITDRRGWRFERPFQLPSASTTTIEVPVSALKEARIEVDRLSELKLAVDTTKLAKRPVLFLDNLRFRLPEPAIVMTVTAAGSGTYLVGPVLTSTATGGPAKKP